MPQGLPDDVLVYLEHAERGRSIRAIARERGVHASTILRKIRKTEFRRDDPLVDGALTRLGRLGPGLSSDEDAMSDHGPDFDETFDDPETQEAHALRLLRALARPGAQMAVTPQVAMAVVVREDAEGRPRQLASAPRAVAEMLALKGFVEGRQGKRIARYRITASGRKELARRLARAESEAQVAQGGLAEAPRAFAHAPSEAGLPGRGSKPGQGAAPRPRRRSAGAESPVQVLARRRDKSGQPWLGPEHIEAAERLRIDFELAQMDGALGQDWTRIMAGGPTRGTPPREGGDARRLDAHRRLEAALAALGPELGEVALMVCCHELGMESAEERLEMPARAGKYVLRIALNLLIRHYEATRSAEADLIW